MAEIIKNVLLNYAVCAFVGGILEYIAPQKAKKTLRIAVVSLLLIGIFSPIAKTEFSFDEMLTETEIDENVSYDALMHTANMAEKKLREEIKEILINEGINEYEIYISTSVDEKDNTVYLEEIKIEVAENFKEKIPVIEKSVSEEYKEILKVGVKNE